MSRGIGQINKSGGRSESSRQSEYDYINKHFDKAPTDKDKRILEAARESFRRKPYYMKGKSNEQTNEPGCT